MTRSALVVLLIAGLCGCATRVPTEEAPGYREDFRRQIGVDPTGIDGDGFPDASDAPEECCKEEDPCREKHKVNLFLGYSTDQGDNGVTIGADYEYKVSESFGVGAFGEFVLGDFRESVLGGGVYFHPIEQVFVFTGAGAVLKKHEETKGLFRFGIGYEHEVRRGWTVGPAGYIDIEEGGKAIFVMGVNIGRGFR